MLRIAIVDITDQGPSRQEDSHEVNGVADHLEMSEVLRDYGNIDCHDAPCHDALLCCYM